MPVVIVVSVGVFAAALAAFDPEPVTFWTPYPKQRQALELSELAWEVLFGGSAGPGKSMTLRGHACDFAYKYPGAHIGIVRRTLPKLKQTHGLHLPGMLRGHARENRTDFTFTFPNGSIIRFVSLQHPGDEQNYKSAEFDVLLFDELTEFEESQYTFMLSRVRSAKGHPTHVIATSNPEGRGFRWVKRRFVAPRPEDLAENQDTPKPGVPWAPPIVEGGEVIGWAPKRAFLPATIHDNPGLLKSNPQYVQQLMALPDGRLRRALLDGDWDAMDAIPGALWSQDVIDANRVQSVPEGVRLVRCVVGLDPSGSSSSGADECGIVVVGLGSDGNCYVIDDLTAQMGPDVWTNVATAAYRRHNADRIVAEVNFGGEMVRVTLEHAEPDVPVEMVNASRGKAVRAEPIAVLTRRGRVKFVGRWSDLEDELTQWTPGSTWSPGGLDALVWAVTQLMGGAAALAFLSALSAHCPECKAVNTAGHPTCFQCGADLPFAQETSAAVVPPGQALTDATPTDPDDDTPVDPGPVVPPGATVIAGLILP